MTDKEATTDDGPSPYRPWHASRYTQERGECIEVSEGPRTAVRDSKHPDHGALGFDAREWCIFIDAAKREGL